MCSTGIIYDVSMSNYHCLWDPDYTEKPARFTRVLERCQSLGLIQRCVDLKPRKATNAELQLGHSQNLIDILKSTSNETNVEKLKELSTRYDCVYFHPNIYELACLAAGCAIELTDQVISGRLRNGFGILRPPGHHAMFDDFCGYCYFNNVVLAARHSLNSGVKRILIVDWDVHHGQGTQRAFYDDPRVVYFSIHRFEYGTFWPELPESDFDHIGEGPGTGFNVNVPLNRDKNTDTDYMSVVLEVLLPLAMEFEPELVLVSAGFDPAFGCPEGEQNVSPAAFAHMMHLCNSFAGGKSVAFMEGGYFMTSHAEGAALTLKTLLGDPCPKLPEDFTTPCPEIRDAILNIKTTLRPFWKCFQKEDYDVKYVARTIWKGRTEPVPTVFDPMCPTPPRPKEFEQVFEDQLEQWISSTELRKSKIKLGFSSFDGRFVDHMWSLAHAMSVFKNGQINEILKAIKDDEIQSGLAVLPLGTFENLNPLACQDFKRVISININDHFSHVEDYSLKSDALVFSFQPTNQKPSYEYTKSTLKFQFHSIGDDKIDAHLFHALYRLILPLSYEFGPDLVVIRIVQENHWLTPKCHGMLAYLMSILAQGRILVLLQGQPEIKTLEYTAESLIDWQPPKQSINAVSENASNYEVVESARQEACSQWKCINWH
ncbi:polyamine deacetylase HDAC10-like [Tigriopus californicus]|uniref:polyamine deacetylase HDAC10-like n=1 Tax=Tigriopus californicus TaxID=6832 RepID=UPI0027DA5D1D|nr:polyamine deacetylase HDAC10-like [Tigriopus californicus]